jgi:hypothetical protein
MKTPEELADRIERQAILCVSLLAMNDGEYFAAKKAYKAGYQAAKDQFADSSKVMPQWISVKDRLPEIPENDYSNCVLLLRADKFIVIARVEKCVRFVRPLQEAVIVETDNGDPIEEFTHWMPLPAAPKEEA